MLASLLVPILLFQCGGAPVRMALRFDRQAILAGEVWRLLTAHFVHLGWTHCLLNAAGLCLCLALAGNRHGMGWWWRRTIVLALGISLALLWLPPHIPDYVGLSGVLYGFFVLVLLPMARRDWLAAAVLLFVVGRMLWQLLAGASPDEERLIGGMVIGAAHAYGVALALAMLAWRAVGRFRARAAP
ncbi:Rhomboid family protein [Pigmentiphaga humi]|uniref:Rhomboid family protein n=1 Tax=Pigmentiphaga humi TaxID=2478468 RepID=A0A3P4B960_9BURK|nr:Rhomboid family protein [Pigmentiphaga humi]